MQEILTPRAPTRNSPKGRQLHKNMFVQGKILMGLFGETNDVTNDVQYFFKIRQYIYVH